MKTNLQFRIVFLFIPLLLATTILAVSQDVNAASAKPPEMIEVAADLPDSSVEIVGYLIVPPDLYKKGKSPLAVLLHQKGESHKVWAKLWSSLYVQGIAVLAVDLRGHGLSIFDLKTQRNRSPNTHYQGEFLKYPDDVKFLVDTCIALHGDKIDASNIAVVGASIGANTAIQYAVMEPRVNYVGMVSPGIDYRGVTVPDALARIEDVDVFIGTAEMDLYSATSVELLADFYRDKFDYEFYSTVHHGNRLINSSPELYQKLLADIVRHLRPEIKLVE